MKQEIELLKTAVPPLLAWFRKNKRDLPWRQNRTPYTALVAELMLQQTRVEAVKERYVRFLNRFPAPAALAEASEEEVLKEWEGLGYYSRARNLKKACEIIAREGFPQTWVGVRALPGVGDYTAGAVCSIALGLNEPAVDGNVLRILTRLYADGSNISDPATKKKFSELLKEVFPDDTADFSEALMELGALVCVPNGAPMCGACPWCDLCVAHAKGEETAFPVKSEKAERKVVEATVLVLRSEGKFALVKREEGVLKGMYGFPFFEGARDPAPFGKVLAEKRAKHVFTHLEWRMHGYLIEAAPLPEGNFVWAAPREIASRYPVPSAFGAFLEWTVC